MTTYIYMNHHIRDPKTTEPVIVVQHGDKRMYVNKIRISGPSYVVTGMILEDAIGHNVRAWIETDSKVEVLS